MGDRLKVMWVEEDNLFLADYDFTLTETIYFRTGDIVAGTATYSGDGFLRSDMGDALIKYCDNTDGQGKYYTTGDFEFYVNQ